MRDEGKRRPAPLLRAARLPAKPAYSLQAERSISGLDLDVNEQLALLGQFHYAGELAAIRRIVAQTGTSITTLQLYIKLLGGIMMNQFKWLVVSTFWLFASSAQAATIYINPSASSTGNGTQTTPYKSWASVTFAPGNSYLQLTGTTFTGSISVTAKGSASGPIVLSSYGTGALPIIVGSIYIDGASFIRISNLNIGYSAYASVHIRNGATDNIVENNRLMNSQSSGISFKGNVARNIVRKNIIANHKYFGVNMFEASNSLGNESLIQENQISQNGSHGIEIKGNYFKIHGNLVQGNGYSGIHTYAGGYINDPFKNFGNYNELSLNVVANHKGHFDGNGIQLDQLTHDNTVAQNLCHDNDGAGISMYDAYSNLIYKNVTLNNRLIISPYLYGYAELTMTASARNKTHDNQVIQNTLIALQVRNQAIFVDDRAAVRANSMYGNLLANIANSNAWAFHYRFGKDNSLNQIKWPGYGPDDVRVGSGGAGIGDIYINRIWQPFIGARMQSLGIKVIYY